MVVMDFLLTLMSNIVCCSSGLLFGKCNVRLKNNALQTYWIRSIKS